MTDDAAVAMFAAALVRTAGSPARAISLKQMMDDNPEMTVAQCLDELERASREDVR